jgi:hypothetical protein
MRYTMTRPRKLQERFEVANEAGETEFEARIHISGPIALLDRTGRELARSHGSPGFGSGFAYGIRVEGKDVATVFHVPHAGFRITSAFGELEATCQTTGYGDRWTLTRDGVRVATEEDQILKDDPVRGTGKYRIEITDGENAAFALVALFVLRYNRNGLLAGQ